MAPAIPSATMIRRSAFTTTNLVGPSGPSRSSARSARSRIPGRVQIGGYGAVASGLGQTPVVSIRRNRPADSVLSELVERCRADALTYEPKGVTRFGTQPPGYRLDRWTRPLGRGDDVFFRARSALVRWRVHTGAGLRVVADGPPAVNCMVAMSAPLPIGFIDVVCRVVDVEDDPDRFGFSYGTVSVHPEQGEESFTVARAPGGDVVFEIVAVSRPRHLLAKVGAPVARRLQLAATQRYLDAMVSEIAH